MQNFGELIWNYPVMSDCTANSHKRPVVTGCGYLRLAATVDYSSYEGCTPEKKT